MQSHPDALEYFNRRRRQSMSTGFNAKYIQRSIGLFQIIKVHTRDNVTFDWCLTNRNDYQTSTSETVIITWFV